MSLLVLCTMAKSSLRLGDIELAKGVLEVLAEGGPLSLGDLEVLVRLAHGPAGIFLGTTRGPAHHLRHQVLESRLADAAVGLIDPRVRVQGGVDHDAIDEVVDDRGDRIDAAETGIERGHVDLGRHGASPR